MVELSRENRVPGSERRLQPETHLNQCSGDTSKRLVIGFIDPGLCGSPM